ncbi:hypothetical protein KDK_73780 [Dictyobacter kobayashii]|uniref:Uncharacterized protein n=1 Tax=Dictyobacter kobayashii TaxID=2014872 RepID=A0A402AWV8_9CHLR|nr:hypothetical protein KDK_73780 [Dictyobacter kobayashii]
MKLSQYAKAQGISYRTALRWWKAGQIKGYQAETGTIIVEEGKPEEQAALGELRFTRESLHGSTSPIWNGKSNDSKPIVRPKAIRSPRSSQKLLPGSMMLDRSFWPCCEM